MQDQMMAMRRAAARILNEQLSAAMSLWRELAGEGKESQRKLKLVAMKILNKALAGAYTAWRDIAIEMKEQMLMKQDH